MSMDLGKKTFQHEPEYFIAGTTIRITTAVKTAGAALKAHAPVLLGADGTVSPVTDATKLTGLYGLAAEDTAKDEEAVVYLTGEYFADALAMETGVTAADVEVAFRNIGIFLK